MESDPQRIRGNTLITLPVSFGIHAAVFAMALLLQVSAVEFPQRSPVQSARYLAATEPPAAPPAAPAPPAGQAASPATPPAPAGGETAPERIPDEIPQLAMAAAPDVGVADGVPGGVPGGEAGGALGGVEGGVGRGDAPYEIGGDVLSPIVIESPSPEYPFDAMKELVEGLVRLQLVIDATGRVTDVRMISSSDPVFEKPAMAGVRKWRFRPATRQGVPVVSVFRLALKFQIPDKETAKPGRRWRKRS